jgi:arginine/lysine/ornithine decarboxylase
MDHSAAPLLDALADYHVRDRYGFTPPGHRQGRGADPRTRAALGEDAFRSDVLATAGLDDRTSSHGYLSRAEELMADAVGAEQAFFSTCGSSLSVKAAMLAVAGGQGDLLISRDAHKSGRWMPAPTCAWSACTRWAPGSSRDQCSTGKAISSILTSCPPVPAC